MTQELSTLQVIDCLQVGPVKVEKKRVCTLYTVYKGQEQDSCELIYTYQEAVFDPKDINSRNLASMITAQVALNYGLFCKKIVFDGVFDENDQRFLRDMMENTAREIYVHKILQPNPFLTAEAQNFPPVKCKRYSQAKIEFTSTTSSDVCWKLWATNKQRYAILSSGGKDSLLTYGLLNELGKETHPIFLNESGRHWFTALNAYRYYEKNVAHTVKVWLNSDRLFTWMLRHLPFIRPNFANMRNDQYPIRLWTVAVFLFGSLPLLYKRGIGRVLIGNEYDTTVKAYYHGILHYDGVYDQSRYFDNALSRYYLKKGWGVTQFSMLRNLSELLIEKILVERYPKLQEQQVSCHATSQTDGRVRPCGKCEKCRRIVSMLTVLEHDPTRCGYTKESIASSLEALEKKGLHQEQAAQKQLLFMLQNKGLLQTKVKLKEYPQIMNMRFDSEHAPLETIPVDLRRELYKIYLQHAYGAMKRSQRAWKSFDLLNDPQAMHEAHPFELATIRKDKKEENNEQYKWREMTWIEAKERLQETDIALLPVGAIEQHGAHLPLDVDSFDAEHLCNCVAQACSNPKPLVLPVIAYGVSYHHDSFTGTISISNDTLSRLVYDIGMSIARNGIKKLVIINGHGGNDATLNYAAQMINRDANIFVCVDTGETSDVDIYDLIETPNDVHAGEVETSTTLAVRPHLVKMDQAQSDIPEFSSTYLDFTSKRGVSWHARTEKYSTTGVMGDPTKASREKGEKIWQIMIAHLVTLVEDLKALTMEQIYQRKY